MFGVLKKTIMKQQKGLTMFNKMPTQFVIILISILYVTAYLPSVEACSTLYSRDHKILGKSYDWYIASGMLVVNKRGFQKTALSHGFQYPAQWTARYGSITFNQHGREFPVSGINEKGLVVEVLWSNDTVYPKQTGAPQINELQWVQYQLDNYASVYEVVNNVNSLEISPLAGLVHYMVCDTDQCAAVEFLNGRAHINQNAVALTNDTFVNSESSWSEYSPDFNVPPVGGCNLYVLDRQPKKGELPAISKIDNQLVTFGVNQKGEVEYKIMENFNLADSPLKDIVFFHNEDRYLEQSQCDFITARGGHQTGLGSMGRYLQVRSRLSHINPTPPTSVNDFFNVLEHVWTPNFSKWNIVYDLNKLEVSYRVGKDGDIKKLQVNKFDFSCQQNVLVLDLVNNAQADVTAHFRGYTREANYKQVKDGLSFMAASLPPGVMEYIAAHPERHECTPGDFSKFTPYYRPYYMRGRWPY